MLFSFSAFCETQTQVNNQFPTINSSVVDQINLFEEKKEIKIKNQIKAIELLTNFKIQLIAFKNIDNLAIDDLKEITKAQMSLPSEIQDKLILILISMHNREIKIESGKYVEEFISKKKVQDIIDSKIVPSFKEKKYAKGIHLFLDTLKVQFISQSEDQTENQNESMNPLDELKEDHYIAKLHHRMNDKHFFLPLIIFLVTFPLLLKLIKGSSFLKPFLGAIYFGSLSYGLNPNLEYLLLSILIGFTVGLLTPLNAILFFLSNSSRGHQHKGSNSQGDFLWFKDHKEIKVHGIQGSSK